MDDSNSNPQSEEIAPKEIATGDELTSAIVHIDDEKAESATREIKRDLTPDSIEIDQPDEFDFRYIVSEDLPTGIQYTPEFDSDWVYPSGSHDGGRRDDAPVQGLEIGVLATAETLEQTVHTILDAISMYYTDTGHYPRHRIIKSASKFEELTTDHVGLVAVFQPSPDDYAGLMEHMQAFESGDEKAINSNIENSKRLVQYLGTYLTDANLTENYENIDIIATTGWETATQVATLPMVERYAPLGAPKIYDPNVDNLDLSEDGYSSVDNADFSPRYLSIETTKDLFEP